MANISIDHPNYAFVDNYFYTFDHNIQMLLKVTFDGTLAFCYTLDVPLEAEVQSLSYDGLNFWTLENVNSSKAIIRRWQISNLMCKQLDKFEFTSSLSETINSNALVIEAYTVEFSGDEPSGQTVLSISDGTKMSPGDRLFLGPNLYGDSEYAVVDSASQTSVVLRSPTIYGYKAGDKIRFYKYGYLFNNAYGTDTSTGSVYKFDLYTGSVITKVRGTQYKDIRAADIALVADRTGNAILDYDGDGYLDVFDAIIFVKGSLLFLVDMYDASLRTIATMLLDISTTTTVYDLTTHNSVIYLLLSGYDYSVAQFDKMVRSVSVSTYPAIIPANGVSTATITTTVLDQYNKPVAGKLVRFTASTGSLSAPTATTNADGVATITFISDTNVGTSTITATVDQN